MSIICECSFCGTKYRVGPDRAGTSLACQRCGRDFQIPCQQDTAERPAPQRPKSVPAPRTTRRVARSLREDRRGSRQTRTVAFGPSGSNHTLIAAGAIITVLLVVVGFLAGRLMRQQPAVIVLPQETATASSIAQTSVPNDLRPTAPPTFNAAINPSASQIHSGQGNLHSQLRIPDSLASIDGAA